MDEPKTDEAKVAWLWKRRDEDKAKMVGLESKLVAAREANERLMAEVRELRHDNGRLHQQVRALGVEVNEARVAAADAVTEYRRTMGG